MTEKGKERMKEQLIRKVDRYNAHWTYNGYRFETHFSMQYNEIGYSIFMAGEPGRFRAAVAVERILREAVNRELYSREKEFEGEAAYQSAVERIAGQIAEADERLEPRVQEIWREKLEERERIEDDIGRLLTQ